ncbi:restriction endonuclease subunit S [Acinetobacter pittii]|uniref:restriction endonuclease subunit S n=1 Tax=Acinetobacter pittii TaxID=48296 RepID=UPI00388FACA2
MSKQNKGLVPELRFPEFLKNSGWELVYGNRAFEQISNKDHNSDLPILAVTQEYGAIPREIIDYNVSVTEKSVQSYKVVDVGDFIISLRSFQGGIEYSEYNGLCSPAYVILRNKKGIDKRFFKQYFKAKSFIRDLTKNLEGLRDGKMISYKQFSEILLPKPSTEEQQKIADCLTSIDELIALHTQKLKFLKDHKKGLMQQLFPAEGESVPKLRFPEFLGGYEWQRKIFGEVIQKSFYGTSNSTSDTGVYPVLRMGNMVDGKLQFENLVYIDLSGEEFEKLKLEPGDILFNRTNSYDLVGKVSLFNEVENYVAASYIVTFRLKTDLILPSFCNQLLNTGYYQSLIKTLATRAVSQANINPSKLKDELEVRIPCFKEQVKITDFLESIDTLISDQNEKLSRLKSHKSGLIQKLFPVLEEEV